LAKESEAGSGIEPDVRVEWSLEDYLGEGDPVMEAVMKTHENY